MRGFREVLEVGVGVGGRGSAVYYVGELVHNEKEHSDWLPEQSEFCDVDW